MTGFEMIKSLFDPYDFRARVIPGLLVLLPVVVWLAYTLGETHPFLTAITSALIACGGPYALTSIVRTHGQRAQERLYGKWGGRPTTIFLRHGNDRLPASTKQRYHELIRSKLGISVPTPSEEISDLASADNAYLEATSRLIQLTRDKERYPLLFKELVAYGFNRNCHGVRWMGVSVSVSILAAILLRVKAIPWTNTDLALTMLANLQAEAWLSLSIAAGAMLLWLLHFTESTVQRAGFSYAERLCEALHTIPRSTSRSKNSDK